MRKAPSPGRVTGLSTSFKSSAARAALSAAPEAAAPTERSGSSSALNPRSDRPVDGGARSGTEPAGTSAGAEGRGSACGGTSTGRTKGITVAVVGAGVGETGGTTAAVVLVTA